ncbi:transcriptional regulator [Striga asiatica]|uniref:Transcriptional regulator n=1 Tax=Striga asiatica TaxID=4170 RepID=A0A5A7R060_STRAF|nr:transcriptional regulator [Striga asiatica]
MKEALTIAYRQHPVSSSSISPRVPTSSRTMRSSSGSPFGPMRPETSKQRQSDFLFSEQPRFVSFRPRTLSDYSEQQSRVFSEQEPGVVKVEVVVGINRSSVLGHNGRVLPRLLPRARRRARTQAGRALAVYIACREARMPATCATPCSQQPVRT